MTNQDQRVAACCQDLLDASNGRMKRLNESLGDPSNDAIKNRITCAKLLTIFCLELYQEFLNSYLQKQAFQKEEKEAWQQQGEEIDRRIAELARDIDDAANAAMLDLYKAQLMILECQNETHENLGEMREWNREHEDKFTDDMLLQLSTALRELFEADKLERYIQILRAVAKALMGCIPVVDKLLTIWELWIVLRTPPQREQADAATELLSDLESYVTALTSWGILHQVFTMALAVDFELGTESIDLACKNLFRDAEQRFPTMFEQFCKDSNSRLRKRLP